MKRGFQVILGILVLGTVFASPALAVTATSFSSFSGEEEPTVRYTPATGAFTNDTYDNMTSPSSGVFRFYLRYSPTVWDGDRNTTSADRQRAEVKGLGATQKNNETFEYSHQWKTSRGGSGSFWHVFQLKAVDGDNAPPLITDSIKLNNAAVVQYCSGTQEGLTAARSYTVTVGSFTTTNVRVKVSTSATGEVKASVNGDAMSGVSGIEVYRPSATQYRPKWGSYRSVNVSAPYGNDTVEQKAVMANKK
jgi:hypothetical protein